MGNKIKDFVKSIMINASVAAFNLENKLVKNTDAENRSMTDGGIDISKEHKNEVLNKLRRGEKHEEYTEYFYKLLKRTDEITVDKSLFKKYEDNINIDDNFDFGYTDYYGKHKTELDQDGNEETYNDGNEAKSHFSKILKERERILKFNEHYEFLKDIKFKYDHDDKLGSLDKNILFSPDHLTINEISALDFIRLRKFNDTELIIEFWFEEKSSLLIDTMSPEEIIDNNLLIGEEDNFDETLVKTLNEITYRYYNELHKYNLTLFLIKEKIGINNVYVFKGNEQPTEG